MGMASYRSVFRREMTAEFQVSRITEPVERSRMTHDAGRSNSQRGLRPSLGRLKMGHVYCFGRALGIIGRFVSGIVSIRTDPA